MEVIVNNHWESTATAANDPFVQAESGDMTKFVRLISNIPSKYAATVTAAPKYEHIDVITTVNDKKVLWELKHSYKFNPEKPFKHFWLKLDKLKYMLQSKHKLKGDKVNLCYFAGATSYAYVVDIQDVVDGITNHTIEVKSVWNRKTTMGAADDYQFEEMIFIPLEMFKKYEY